MTGTSGDSDLYLVMPLAVEAAAELSYLSCSDAAAAAAVADTARPAADDLRLAKLMSDSDKLSIRAAEVFLIFREYRLLPLQLLSSEENEPLLCSRSPKCQMRMQSMHQTVALVHRYNRDYWERDTGFLVQMMVSIEDQ